MSREVHATHSASDGSLVAELLRDEWGMAHIYSDREEGGFFALGYAMAEDRLVPLLFNFRRVQGTLAEAFGAGPIAATDELRSVREHIVEDPVASDLRMRRDRYFAHAVANWPELPSQLKLNLESFMQGLNHYLEQHPERRPAWAPELHPALPLALYTSRLAALDEGVCTAKLESAAKDAVAVIGSDAAGERMGSGSNAWAVDASKTASGSVIFSSDSHGPVLDLGTFFYSWRMQAGGIDGYFVDLSGALTLIKGHTRHFAWAWTEGPRAPADCYRVSLKEPGGREYEIDGEVKEIEVVEDTIAIAGEPGRIVWFEYTRHNDVLSPVVERRAEDVYVVSASYTGREGFAHARYHDLTRARDQQSLFEALSAMEIYPANLIIGGRDGLVLFVRPGRIPIRPDGVDTTQILDGNSSETLWMGIHPLADMPSIANPEEGWVGNSNISPDMMYAEAKLDERDYPRYMGFETGYTNSRQLRSIELLDQADSLTFEGALEITTDVTLHGARNWSVALQGVLNSELSSLLDADDSEDWRSFVSELASFDGRFVPESKGALYHVLWREALVEQNSAEANRIAEHVHSSSAFNDADGRLIASAVVSAFSTLREECGTEEGSFGDFHLVRSGANVAKGSGVRVVGVAEEGTGRVPIYATLWANGYQPVGAGCIRELRWGSRNPFVVEFSDPLQSYSLQAFGISDVPSSPHYSDQVPFIAGGRFRSNHFERSEIESNARQIQQFVRSDGVVVARDGPAP